MRLVVNSKGDYYQIIEELTCTFGEDKLYIIIKGDQIMYLQNGNYRDMKLNVEEMRSHIIDVEITKWRSEERKRKTLEFLKETLAKMIAYEREIKIDTLLDKGNPDSQYLWC